MDRTELKRRIIAGEPTPGVEDALCWDVLAECQTEATGITHRVVTLMESVQPPDHHSRFRALLEASASDTPRSDLKADDHVNPQEPNRFLPTGVDLAAAIRRAAEDYKAAGIDLNTTPRAAQMKPITLAESREDLAKRITDPIERAYVLLSGRA